jgi:hypothetical protein
MRVTTRVMSTMKWQVQTERQVNVNGTREKRKHAEREADNETEEIKIRPGHTTPLAQLAFALRGPETETRTLLLATCYLLTKTSRIETIQLRKAVGGG